MLLDTIERLEGGRIRDPETGLIFPWYTSTCLEWLSALDLNGKKIWEYGVGDSTRWYRKKGADVYGVDSDRQWAQKIGMVFFQSYYPLYCSAILDGGTFDMVIIDGEWRDECTEYALASLKSGGLLIIDNYKQPSVPFIWTRTDKLIEGMPVTIYKEPGHVDWQTAVITKP